MMTLWLVNVRDSVVFEIVSQLMLKKIPFDYDFHNHLNNSSGLYCFWLRNSCLYVGMSEDLKRRIAQHSHKEDNPELIKYFRTCPDEIKISIVYLNLTTNKLRDIESRAILELHPVANRQGIS